MEASGIRGHTEQNPAPTFPMMLPTSCKQDKSGVRRLPTPGPPRPSYRPCPRPQAGQAQPHCASLTTPAHQVPAEKPLTFPCISIRSVRVTLSSGSSSSPASELLILPGGAAAEAAWECVHVHAAAWLALAGVAEGGLGKSIALFRATCPSMGTPEQGQPSSQRREMPWTLSCKRPTSQGA